MERLHWAAAAVQIIIIKRKHEGKGGGTHRKLIKIARPIPLAEARSSWRRSIKMKEGGKHQSGHNDIQYIRESVPST